MIFDDCTFKKILPLACAVSKKILLKELLISPKQCRLLYWAAHSSVNSCMLSTG